MRVNFVDLFWNQVLIELIIGALVPFFFLFFLNVIVGLASSVITCSFKFSPVWLK
jgi:uncharacterized membrane protein